MFNFFKTGDAALKFYLKSGNTFVIDKVTDWNIQAGASTENIVSLSITQRPTAKNRLIVQSIVLSQIEAIMVVEG